MNGFDLAGRPIRVGLGNDRFNNNNNNNNNNNPNAQMMQRLQGHHGGHLARGHPAIAAAAAVPHFDRAGGRDDKGAGGASALDDTDVAGVNFNNYSRDALMRKLARTDEPPVVEPPVDDKHKMPKVPMTKTKPLPVTVGMASRCVLLRNMFDPAE